MTCKIGKLIIKFIISNMLLIATFPAFAVISDTKQPIRIESDMQSIDMQSNVVTFSGHVVMTQGTIKINANKVIITRQDGKQGKEIIDSYGNPVTFYQMQDNGKPVKGHALHMHYELAKYLLTLTDNVYLEQMDSNITGDKITYLVKEQEIQACSEKGRHLTTILIPSQFQNKNNIEGGRR